MKIKPWMYAAGALGALWWLSRPKSAAPIQAGTGGTAPGAASTVSGAGRFPHGGGHRFHGGVPWGFAGVPVIDYAPVLEECDPRFACKHQPILPCRCG